MTDYLGLTWDHPRGRDALQAAAREFSVSGSDTLRWDLHSLEGFESSPIDELAERYDLIVLDHPHLGDALEHESLRPVDELFPASELAQWAADTVGPSLDSYRMAGRLWALPLDAATQVSVRRADLLPDAPVSWDDVRALDVPVAIPVAGPHALLSLFSIAVSLGDEPGSGEQLFDREIAGASLALLAELGPVPLNPIQLLEQLSSGGGIAYAPLVYGYVNYSVADRRHPLDFGAAPLGVRTGSTIGGTGIAVTRRSIPSASLLAHLSGLLSPATQQGFIPEHAGQPSARSAWTSAAVNAPVRDFYAATLATIESSWVRPRFARYIPFQTAGSNLVRRNLAGDATADETLDQLELAFRIAQQEGIRS